MTEDVLRARLIELLDEQGQPTVILTSTDARGRAGLLIGSAEEDAAWVTVSIDHRSGNPIISMQASENGEQITIGFVQGKPRIFTSVESEEITAIWPAE